MVSTLETIPGSVDVTTDSVGTWKVTFAAALAAIGGGATLASAAAVLYTAPPGAKVAVPGFVIGAAVNGTSVDVGWSGAALTEWSTYRLETRGTLSTGAVVEFLTEVRCIA